jgi:Rrf2 family protein
MHVSARSDYAVRAVVELAASDRPMTAEELAAAQDIPRKFLTAILAALKRAQILRSQRGAIGGYRLARPATEISVADVMRAVEGQLADVRGERAESLTYDGTAVPLQVVWVALRSSLRSVLEGTTVAQIAADRLPRRVVKLTEDAAAWR